MSHSREEEWRRIVSEVRRVYSGRLTYAANWDRLDRVPFWDAGDWIGVQAYFPLTDRPDPDRPALTAGWEGHLDEPEALSRREVEAHTVDGGERSSVAWPDWSVTTTTDAYDHWQTVWEAIQRHRTQMEQYGVLEDLPPERHRAPVEPKAGRQPVGHHSAVSDTCADILRRGSGGGAKRCPKPLAAAAGPGGGRLSPPAACGGP